ncbi:serine protein kinase [Pseudomassariella vexata]|uniref:non-specific serine/threonine protein kinase n=1 Tax=Pseudomassariella vexata TaxID=1141098 RepID=A0A1Y2EIJ9_9PEZI|nr:serine protein kinase [Pseudomassariella vexata]ORY71412.1 serine protein kinase [Pseudomassariella vexata]
MQTSPPPTPPSSAPDDREWRFKKMTSPCEWIEDYQPGGYHPVHLGDVFKNGQYKILRKLGEGSYSTVWLARDLWTSKYVAIKILVGSSEATSELQILRYITQNAPTEGSQHITQLVDYFEHCGPNGVHKCLVFEPMGPSVNTMVEELPQFKPRKWGMKVRYPPQMAKNILKQSLQALKVLHEYGIAHGGFQPGNIFFERRCTSNSISAPVQRLDGKQDKWAPRYLCIAKPLVPSTPCNQGFKIKLADMGGAFFFTDPPKKPVTPLGLRPPELILTGEVHRTIDIWSFGCLTFQIVTGQPLICVPWYDSESYQDDDHLLSLTACLGALPDKLYREWKNSSLYFTPEGKLFNYLEEQEAHQVKTLIRWILQYDPAARPSPAEVLLHPWFSQDETKSGTFK